MRDVISIPIDGEFSLIIASDNSGGIGAKKDDLVHVPYDTVAYYSFRVAVMECIAAGGNPVSVVIHNFCGNEQWKELVSGVQKGLLELGLTEVSITGSTESNFSLLQSAVGLIVVGKKSYWKKKELVYTDQLKFAVIGMPLVGNEVIKQANHVVPLSVFQELSRLKNAVIWPVGSKGILHEMNQVFSDRKFTIESLMTTLDVLKSSGPATCFIVVYQEKLEEEIRQSAMNYFHPLQIDCKLGGQSPDLLKR
jgi:hypothetical protein